MGNSSSTPKITAQDKAILDLKVQRDKLKQYQKKITYLTTLETDAAREALRQKNRPAALLALRRKKYQETLLQRTDEQLSNLQMLAGDVEFALVQKDVVFGLQRGTEVLKEIRKEMGGVEGVEKLMGRNEEEKAYQEEIGDMLRGQLSVEDEEDVEEELKVLEDRQTGKVSLADGAASKVGSLPDASKVEPLPQAPSNDRFEEVEDPEERKAQEPLAA